MDDKYFSSPWFFKQLNQLCQEEKLIRYKKGIYYIPTQTSFGKILLNPPEGNRVEVHLPGRRIRL